MRSNSHCPDFTNKVNRLAYVYSLINGGGGPTLEFWNFFLIQGSFLFLHIQSAFADILSQMNLTSAE